MASLEIALSLGPPSPSSHMSDTEELIGSNHMTHTPESRLCFCSRLFTSGFELKLVLRLDVVLSRCRERSWTRRGVLLAKPRFQVSSNPIWLHILTLNRPVNSLAIQNFFITKVAIPHYSFEESFTSLTCTIMMPIQI